MLDRVRAERLFVLAAWLGRFSEYRHPSESSGKVIPDNQRKAWREHFERIQLPPLDFPVTVKALARLVEALSGDEGLTYGQFGLRTYDVGSRLHDELEAVSMWIVSAKYAHHLNELAPAPFGDDVAQKFPTAALDIEESGKCLALGRNTASVFHLMRVMELALKAVAAGLGIPGTNPGWDAILTKIDEELKKKHQQKPSAWRAQEQFFAEIAAHLRAVKTAWRNPTMHVAAVYDEERAADIFNAVRSFMRHIATGLSE